MRVDAKNLGLNNNSTQRPVLHRPPNIHRESEARSREPAHLESHPPPTCQELGVVRPRRDLYEGDVRANIVRANIARQALLCQMQHLKAVGQDEAHHRLKIKLQRNVKEVLN